MFAMAARRLGYRVHTLAPEHDTPTGQISDLEIVADYDDLDRIRDFACGVDVVTFEFENVSAAAVHEAEEHAVVRPNGRALAITQHRLREKTFLVDRGLPVAPFALVTDEASLAAALDQVGRPAVLKTTTLGYDEFGNLEDVTTPPNASGQAQSYHTRFDATAAMYPVEVRDGFEYASSATYDLRFGIATSEIDVNSVEIRRTLDAHGRLETVRGPYDTVRPALAMEYFLDEIPRRAKTTTHPAAPPGFSLPDTPLIAKYIRCVSGDCDALYILLRLSGESTTRMGWFDSGGGSLKGSPPLISGLGIICVSSMSRIPTATAGSVGVAAMLGRVDDSRGVGPVIAAGCVDAPGCVVAASSWS